MILTFLPMNFMNSFRPKVLILLRIDITTAESWLIWIILQTCNIYGYHEYYIVTKVSDTVFHINKTKMTIRVSDMPTKII